MGKERVEVWWRDGEVVCVVVVSYAANLNVKISPHNKGRLTWYYNICCSTEKKNENTKKLNFRFTDHHGYENLLLFLKWYTYKNEHFILNIIIECTTSKSINVENIFCKFY